MYLIKSRSTNVLRYFVNPVQEAVADAEKSSRIPGSVLLR